MKTVQTRPFPIQLLNASAATRIKYFRDCRIEHPHLTRSFDQAMSAITSACGPKVVVVTGPTGAGKSGPVRIFV